MKKKTSKRNPSDSAPLKIKLKTGKTIEATPEEVASAMHYRGILTQLEAISPDRFDIHVDNARELGVFTKGIHIGMLEALGWMESGKFGKQLYDLIKIQMTHEGDKH